MTTQPTLPTLRVNSSARISAQLVLAVCLAQPATAQRTTYYAAPLLGVYLPTGDLVHNQIVPDPGPLQPETITIGHEAGWMLGFRGTRVLSGKLAVEVELQYASSEVELRGTRREPADQPARRLDARVVALGANALYEVFRAPFTPFGIHLLGGLGLVSRGGEFFDEGGGFFGKFDGGTDVALILGGGFRYGLSPRLGVRVDIRDYLSSYRQSLPGGELDAELQNDLWITAGLEYAL